MDKSAFLSFNRPLVVVTICYIAGIAWGGAWLDCPCGGIWLLLGLPLLLAVAAVFGRLFPLFLVGLLLIACAAGAVSFLVSAGLSPGDVLSCSGYSLYVEGTVVEEPLRVGNNTTYQIQVEMVETGEGRFPTSGKLLVKVYGADQEPYWFGEKLRLRGVIDEPRGRRNPGGFDYRFYLRTSGIGGVMHLRPYQVVSLGTGEASSPTRSILTLRARLVKGIGDELSSPHAELLSAILFGQRHLLPGSVQENFKQSGVSHLLAVSGLHVGLVAALFLGFCHRLKIKGRLPLVVVVMIVFGYAYLTGMRPPALRAAVMFSMASGALLLDRENDLSTAICIAALLTLAVNPLHLFTAGFQLSYAATLAIIYAFSPLTELFQRLKFPSFIRTLLAVTLAAQLGVLPICAAHFQHIPLGALWFNLLLLPVMPPVVGLGLIAALLQLISPVLAWPLFQGVHLLLEYILVVTDLSRFTGFHLSIYVPILIWGFYYVTLGLALVCYYRWRDPRAKLSPEYGTGSADACRGSHGAGNLGDSLISGATRIKGVPGVVGTFGIPTQTGTPEISGVAGPWSGFDRYRRLWPFNLLLVALTLIAVLIWGDLLSPVFGQQRFRVTFIDVGQGASALVESGQGRILIDCGGKMPFTGSNPEKIGEQVLLPFLRYRGVRSLDLVIVTHPHEDHFGGLKPLLECIAVKSIWISPQPGSSPYYEQALEEACAQGIPVRKVQAGQKWSDFGLTLEVLAPPHPLHTGTGSDENNNSIVLRLFHPRAGFLFCGDIEQVAVQDLLRRQPFNLRAEVLLVPHHGGPLPDLPRLIKAVRPRIAVIQVGNNPFGHPHLSTLENLQQAGVLTFRNDLHGAIIVDTNSKGLTVETMSTEKQAVSNW